VTPEQARQFARDLTTQDVAEIPERAERHPTLYGARYQQLRELRADAMVRIAGASRWDGMSDEVLGAFVRGVLDVLEDAKHTLPGP
jgi:hypothetical protein